MLNLIMWKRKSATKMVTRAEWVLIENCGFHKGFYNDEDYLKSLQNIHYSDFFEVPDEEDFIYHSAYVLLNGSCNHFAIALSKVHNYNAYIIQPIDKECFHAFCQIHIDKQWYYVDARGITSSFDEFINGVKSFVGNEFTIRKMSQIDIDNWEKECKYNSEAYAFSEAIINKYSECYLLT